MILVFLSGNEVVVAMNQEERLFLLKIIIQEVMKVLQSEVLQRKLEQISEEKGIEEILNFHQ